MAMVNAWSARCVGAAGGLDAVGWRARLGHGPGAGQRADCRAMAGRQSVEIGARRRRLSAGNCVRLVANRLQGWLALVHRLERAAAGNEFRVERGHRGGQQGSAASSAWPAQVRPAWRWWHGPCSRSRALMARKTPARNGQLLHGDIESRAKSVQRRAARLAGRRPPMGRPAPSRPRRRSTPPSYRPPGHDGAHSLPSPLGCGAHASFRIGQRRIGRRGLRRAEPISPATRPGSDTAGSAHRAPRAPGARRRRR